MRKRSSKLKLLKNTVSKCWKKMEEKSRTIPCTDTNQWTNHKILSRLIDNICFSVEPELIRNLAVPRIFVRDRNDGQLFRFGKATHSPVTIRIHFATHPILHPPSSKTKEKQIRQNSRHVPQEDKFRTRNCRRIPISPARSTIPCLPIHGAWIRPTLASVIPRNASDRRRRRSSHGSTRWIRMA